jgi:hypothetical protein
MGGGEERKKEVPLEGREDNLLEKIIQLRIHHLRREYLMDPILNKTI